jgi:hypothetical protein
MPDQHDRAAVQPAEPGHQGTVVGTTAIPVQLDPVVEDACDVVECVRPVLMPGELDRVPDLLVAGVHLQAVELAPETLGLARHLRATEQRQPRQPRQPLPQVDLLVLRRHSRSGAGQAGTSTP